MAILNLFFIMFIISTTSMAVRQCFVFPIRQESGIVRKVDCTSHPDHDSAASGCFYRRYTEDSDQLAGFVEGGCGASLCKGGKEKKCRSITESEDGFSINSNFCCCYGSNCNTLDRAEALV